MQNVARTVVSQYANSPAITALVDEWNDAIDPDNLWNDFYNLIWNVDTAQGYGLDVWGRIVGIGRVIHLPVNSKYFGFDEATTVSADPFNNSPYYGGNLITTNYAVSDTGFRSMILAKALANICDGSIPGINAVLLLLFPARGNCYVTDGQNMTMTYTFTFPLTAIEFSIVTQSGILPKPAGVSVTVVII